MRPFKVAFVMVVVAVLFYAGLIRLLGINVFTDLEIGWFGWTCIGLFLGGGYGLLCLTLPRARDNNVPDVNWKEGNDD